MWDFHCLRFQEQGSVPGIGEYNRSRLSNLTWCDGCTQVWILKSHLLASHWDLGNRVFVTECVLNGTDTQKHCRWRCTESEETELLPCFLILPVQRCLHLLVLQRWSKEQTCTAFFPPLKLLVQHSATQRSHWRVVVLCPYAITGTSASWPVLVTGLDFAQPDSKGPADSSLAIVFFFSPYISQLLKSIELPFFWGEGVIVPHPFLV